MSESAQEIIDRLFARAAEDAEAAPLAEAFARSHRDGEWTADALEVHVRALIDRAPSDGPGAEAVE